MVGAHQGEDGLGRGGEGFILLMVLAKHSVHCGGIVYHNPFSVEVLDGGFCGGSHDV